mmetsp:Transcript_15220/g.22251  ORF Transcript_15220/g.22251 Transcript_15220/m.22251 type:complete len:109 (+) Transcript_15220:30-356(+)
MASSCNTLQQTRCNRLQHAATHSSDSTTFVGRFDVSATLCNRLQQTAGPSDTRHYSLMCVPDCNRLQQMQQTATDLTTLMDSFDIFAHAVNGIRHLQEVVLGNINRSR